MPGCIFFLALLFLRPLWACQVRKFKGHSILDCYGEKLHGNPLDVLVDKEGRRPSTLYQLHLGSNLFREMNVPAMGDSWPGLTMVDLRGNPLEQLTCTPTITTIVSCKARKAIKLSAGSKFVSCPFRFTR